MVADMHSKNSLNIVLKLEKYGAIKFYSKNSGIGNNGINK